MCIHSFESPRDPGTPKVGQMALVGGGAWHLGDESIHLIFNVDPFFCLAYASPKKEHCGDTGQRLDKKASPVKETGKKN